MEESASACMNVCGGHIGMLRYTMAHAVDMVNLWPTETNEKGKQVCPLQKAQEKVPNLKPSDVGWWSQFLQIRKVFIRLQLHIY